MPLIRGRHYRTETDITERLRHLVAECDGNVHGDAREEWNELNTALDSMQSRTAGLRSAARSGAGTTEDGARVPSTGSRTPEPDPFTRERTAVRDAALRTIERYQNEGELTAPAADRLDDLVRVKDRSGLDAQYLAAVGDPAYNSAFGKILGYQQMASMRFTPEEARAVQRVTAVEEMRTTLQVGSDGAGGFAIPFTLDPSVVLTSAGAQTAVRQYARVETISTDKWKGVSSTGITAAFAAELTEASDNAPALLQPTADSAKAMAFVPYSIEIGQDWGQLQREMATMIADAKATLESTEFLTGNGVDRPLGILSGATTVVTGATSGVLAVADVYGVMQALPPRFQDNAVASASPTIWDSVYRLVGGGNTTEPPLLPTREGPVLGRTKFEWSSMATTTANGNLIIIVGDWSYFLIADRIGMTIEIIPHLFGTARQMPIGARGLFAYWRTASTVLSTNAFRIAKVK